MKKLFIIILLVSGTFHAAAQEYWSVLLKHQKHELVNRDDMAVFSKSGFFLYKNCLYSYTLKNNKQYNGRLVDVKKDSLCFANYTYPEKEYNADDKFDTVSIHVNDMTELLLPRRSFPKKLLTISLDKYDFIFIKDTINLTIESIYGYTFLKDEADNELIPRLTSDSIIYCFEYKGRLYKHSFETFKYEPSKLQNHLKYDPASGSLIFYFRIKR